VLKVAARGPYLFLNNQAAPGAFRFATPARLSADSGRRFRLLTSSSEAEVPADRVIFVLEWWKNGAPDRMKLGTLMSLQSLSIPKNWTSCITSARF
jgi:hypothetical protein